jgi:hypothetical protein
MKKLTLLIILFLSFNCWALLPKYYNADDVNLDLDLQRLHDRIFNLLPVVVSTVPTTDTLESGQSVWYVSGTTERLYYNIDGTIDYLTDSTALALKAPVANGYPQRDTMFHDQATVITGNAIAPIYVVGFTGINSNALNYAYQNACANGDSFSNSFFLKAGTYNFYILGIKNTNCGKIDWYIDGVKVVSQDDWYGAALAVNEVFTHSVTVVGDGYHKLVGTVNGKNASSVSPYYNILLTRYWFAPVADPDRE